MLQHSLKLTRQVSLVGLLAFSALAPSVAAQTNTPASSVAYRGNTRAYLGAYLGDLADSKGAIVGKVADDSPAAKAGLQINDVLLRFDQTVLENKAHVYRLLGEMLPGSKINVEFMRSNEPHSLTLVLGERQGVIDPCKRLYAQADLVQAEANRLRQLAEDARQKGNEEEVRKRLEESAAFAKQAATLREDVDRAISEGQSGDCHPEAKAVRAQLGLVAIPLNEQLAKVFKVTGGTGLLITEVKPGSAAAQQGLKAGDCLLSVNDQPLTSLAELQRLFNRGNEPTTKAAAPGTQIKLTLGFVRAGERQSVVLAR